MASGVGWSAFVSIGCFVLVLRRIKWQASWHGAGLACFAVVASQHSFGLPEKGHVWNIFGGQTMGYIDTVVTPVDFLFKGDG